ncbi:MAG: hypothetical protein E7A62_02160 [Actinomycetaceae bacterium]|nr:hypothetical protein [Actinomycetaceae bacterium]MDU0969783.1 hypothetical protein [Actinomycetaceae bacterium]
MELFGFGFSGPELVVLTLIILFVAGPKHLVAASRQVARAIAWAKEQSAALRQSSAADLAATGLGDVDWSAYDPRKLDPRRMIHEAVREEMDAWMRDMSAHATPTESTETPVQAAPTGTPAGPADQSAASATPSPAPTLRPEGGGPPPSPTAEPTTR